MVLATLSSKNFISKSKVKMTASISNAQLEKIAYMDSHNIEIVRDEKTNVLKMVTKGGKK